MEEVAYDPGGDPLAVLFVLIGALCQLSILILPFIVLIVGGIAGNHNQRKHFESLARREQIYQRMLLSDLKRFPGGTDSAKVPQIVTAEVVIATDQFKNLVAKFFKLVGGNIRSYESLVERARREALLRLQEQAANNGFNALCNLRVETVDLGSLSGKGDRLAICALAAATAYRRPAAESPRDGADVAPPIS